MGVKLISGFSIYIFCIKLYNLRMASKSPEAVKKVKDPVSVHNNSILVNAYIPWESSQVAHTWKDKLIISDQSSLEHSFLFLET